jgi:hypothetical protein
MRQTSLTNGSVVKEGDLTQGLKLYRLVARFTGEASFVENNFRRQSLRTPFGKVTPQEVRSKFIEGENSLRKSND